MCFMILMIFFISDIKNCASKVTSEVGEMLIECVVPLDRKIRKDVAGIRSYQICLAIPRGGKITFSIFQFIVLDNSHI